MDMYVFMYVGSYTYIYIFMCVCVCVFKRGRKMNLRIMGKDKLYIFSDMQNQGIFIYVTY